MPNPTTGLLLTLTFGLTFFAHAQDSRIAATAGDITITTSELDELAQGRLIRLRAEEYELKQRLLEETIAQRLLEREAQTRGISLDELLRLEVESRVAPVTDAEARGAYEINAGSPNAADSVSAIAEKLHRKRIDDRRAQFVASLREKAGVRVLLTPPRVRIEAGDGPSLGAANAPVTIVAFSEFQCSYCARVAPTLKQVHAHYGDSVRVVFRNFPLPNHKEAAKAAEAALCAGEQQKFWELHDQLFANQTRLQLANLRRFAADTGLDTARFNQCLDSGRFASRVEADRVTGTRYGVNGTPTFFINGRPLVGAVPFESFARVIDEELARTPSSPQPASASGAHY